MDTFHPTMKAWLFLHEVPVDEGPLTFVRGSTRRDEPRLAWERQKSIDASETGGGGAFRVRPDELPGLGLEQPLRFAVPGNTLVVGEMTGFHARGSTVRPTIRYEIYASSRRNPFLPIAGLDVWSLPFLKRRKVARFWWLLGLRERFGLGRSQWEDAGLVTASDRAGSARPVSITVPTRVGRGREHVAARFGLVLATMAALFFISLLVDAYLGSGGWGSALIDNAESALGHVLPGQR
jgi:hypothetical protein